MSKRPEDTALSMEVAVEALLAWLDLARVEVRTLISAGSPVCSTERRPNEERGDSEGESLEGIVSNSPELYRGVDSTTFDVKFPVRVRPCRLVL